MTSTQEEKRRFPDIVEQEFWDIYQLVSTETLLSTEKLYNFYMAIKYIVDREIPGDIVECGVWRGGAVMLAGETLARLGDNRKIYGYDTFEGFTERSDCDITLAGKQAGTARFANMKKLVEDNLSKTNFHNYTLVEGDILKTLARTSHSTISILRLDTDTYSTTLHELTTCYGAVQPGGVLIIDDYGHCEGARRATDNYFSNTAKPFFQRPNWSSRTAIKS